MLFHTFGSQEERRAFGGSDFIELQYCRLERGTELRTIVSVDTISFWKLDSLYVYGDDLPEFLLYYDNLFSDGIYNNGACGPVDVFGINYYSREQAKRILKAVKNADLPGGSVLRNWLKEARNANGFYILGE